MGKAGWQKNYLGIETGSKRMQKAINKNLNISEAKKNMKINKKNKITIKKRKPRWIALVNYLLFRFFYK